LAVHPHVRGDYPPVPLVPFFTSGPSPRVWGLRASQRSIRPSGAVHPHVCGDYPCVHPGMGTAYGPSPRVWGLRGAPFPAASSPRSIPTCVGTTESAHRKCKASSVHPHVCGDYVVLVFRKPPHVGPSPRVWGLPAAPGRSTGTRPVHPHVCGDYARPRGPRPARRRSIPTCVGTTSSPSTTRATGSGPSPRVWGLRGPGQERRRPPRSIPTCVGTTGATPGTFLRAAVHPHVCGDYWAVSSPHRSLNGPSPRVWGLRAHRRRDPHGPRSIPTCVGTTGFPLEWPSSSAVHPHVCGDYSSRAFSTPRSSVHPHVCGDYAGGLVVRKGGAGPSPRVWGLPGRPRDAPC